MSKTLRDRLARLEAAGQPQPIAVMFVYKGETTVTIHGTEMTPEEFKTRYPYGLLIAVDRQDWPEGED